MNKIWNQAPLVRLLLPFLAGIFIAVRSTVPLSYLSFFLGFVFLCIVLMVLIKPFRPDYKNSWFFGSLTVIALFLAGHQLCVLNTAKFSSSHFSKVCSGKELIHARIEGAAIEKENSIKVILTILNVNKGNDWQTVSGKAMVHIKKDSASLKLISGDELLFSSVLKEVPGPQNPSEFDYAAFLSSHSIYHQAYLKSGTWINTGINRSNPILEYSVRMRDWLLKILSDNGLKGNEYAVGAALLLGYEDKLEGEIISAYSSTGALHVLSVSGLHVAIIYVVFNWLLFFLDKFKNGKTIKAVILILLLWFYAALTGLSPSVLRAATMFSFIIIAQAFKWHTNIYNTLAASAFLLLIIDPFLFMEVGFQLSYLAVLGIVYLQPKIYSRMDPENRILDQIWQITSVSIAAQIATFPIGLYYFHQFPNYFLISNLVVIPLSTLIIYMGIALFAFGSVPVIAGFISACFGWCISLLNSSVQMMERWPHAIIEGVSITVLETCLLYFFILSLMGYIAQRKFRFLVVSIIFLLMILLSQVNELSEQQSQKKIVVYNINKTSAIDFIAGRSNVLLTDSTFAKNSKGLQFRVKNNWWDLGLTNNEIVTGNGEKAGLIIRDHTIGFCGKTIIHIKEDFKSSFMIRPLKVDLLIISNNAQVSMQSLLMMFDPGKIVFDSSNSAYKIRKWKMECESAEIESYFVVDRGAFQLNL
ncbi:MAG: competence protein ComEC family protein [Bacteroidota bacterium]|nr:competence protein ComEC family protein [Bacteroidota bacterium]